MRALYLLICISLQMPLQVLCQEYGYTAFNIKDGLAGSTAYCATQDRDGFMWFGTETGLSRFDGTHFRNFFREDGLPENQVIQVFADSKGKVWIAPFSKSLCYYYKGKIYNSRNDSLLKQIHVKEFVIDFAEDADGNILIQETSRLYLIKANKELLVFDSIGHSPIVNCAAISRSLSGGFSVVMQNQVYELRNNRFIFQKNLDFTAPHFAYIEMTSKLMIWERLENRGFSICVPGSDKRFDYPLDPGLINFGVLDDRRAVECTKQGAYIFDIDDPCEVKYFMKGMRVTKAFKDNEDNIWFMTIGQGVHRLNSEVVMNIYFKGNNAYKESILSVCGYKGSVLAGSDVNGVVYRIDKETGKPHSNHFLLPFKDRSFDPIVLLHALDDDKIICATSYWLLEYAPLQNKVRSMANVVAKQILPRKNDILVATNKTVLKIDRQTFKVQDTIWKQRATSILASGDTIYIGTLDGLYRLLPGNAIQFLGVYDPLLKNSITGIVKDPNNIIWISTYSAGVLGYRGDRIVKQINKANGLTSNLCRTIYLHHNNLWVGTDKGLNKIGLDEPGYPVHNYTTSDGLASDIIHAIYIDGNKVFTSTPEGVTFFDDQKMVNRSHCNLLFTGITISGRAMEWNGKPLQIPHSKNNIRFDYVGITFKSGGDVRYRYRLLGLDSAWQETRETFLSYPTLPSGEYEMQVQAVNKFNVKSRVITASFTIEKLLWEKGWFRLLAGIVFLACAGLLVWAIVHRIRNREEEKTAISKRIGNLEQLARKSQMNPHFIFNSLNSIQQYVMDTDLAGANRFIAGFSRLIRQTLDFSSQQEISLEEEIDYLTNYLELEKTRLEDTFSWKVIMAKDIDPAEYYLPPMILQPFVENSIRHGLRFRKDNKGMITISVRKEQGALVCIIEDNGIGRKTAAQLKSRSHIEYQSKGMSLTAERIQLLNKDNFAKIVMQIDDLEDEQHRALGTRITLRFPAHD